MLILRHLPISRRLDLIALHNAEIDDAQMLIVEMILNAREVARRQVASED